MGIFDGFVQGQIKKQNENEIERLKRLIIEEYTKKDPNFEKFLNEALMNMPLGEAVKIAEFEKAGDLSYFRNFVERTWKRYNEKKQKQQEPQPPKTPEPPPPPKPEKTKKTDEISVADFARMSFNNKIKVLEKLVEDDMIE